MKLAEALLLRADRNRSLEQLKQRIQVSARYQEGAMESNAPGSGYRFVASDGGVFDFGSSGFFGAAVS